MLLLAEKVLMQPLVLMFLQVDIMVEVLELGTDLMMIVECKAQTVKITQKTLDQAVRYYSALQPRFLLLFNGLQCYCFHANDGVLSPFDHLPDYAEMSS